MKAGFFHDTPLIQEAGKFYSVNFDANLWKRYLSVFDELSVSTRIRSGDTNNLSLSSCKNVNFSPIKSYTGPISLFLKFPQVLKEIKTSLVQVDCAIIRLPSMIGWITFMLAILLQKPVLIESVGCPWDAYRFQGLLGKVAAPAVFIANRLSIKYAPFVIYVTEDFLQGRYPTKGKSIAISNVSINIDSTDLEQRLNKIRNSYSENSLDFKKTHTYLIGSIGTIDMPFKGHSTALKSLKLLRDQGINAKYEIVGPGDPTQLLSEIEELGLQNHVTLIGRLNSKMIKEWLHSIDIYVQPSTTEGLPRAVIEAMAVGVPAILSNVGGHPELVPNNCLFKAKDSTALANKLKYLLEQNLESFAIENFAKAKNYDLEILQERRQHFLFLFREYAERKN